ncbi:uncharacterized protein M421DRAFT_423510 [Didymella exigua CBS 183.55]|uniref:Uncharacterized protein n=1 Tax=Didymella exigua CBS 183.55 TaxID=1150837 RepID=A0A6A5RBR5_9PLEO|nr:uncharacterized protein M421DRAFT_423510 [Didymella exigua CBS 183.55]KAF1925681.1 hypothetical protein M421DRAFT_423510 [Didymella exigua CBS 183.55]
MNLSSDFPDTITLDQDAISPMETAVDDDISEHASAEPSEVVDAVPSNFVDDSQNIMAPHTSSASDILQRASTETKGSRSPPLGAGTGCTLTQPPATIFPPSITTEPPLSQSTAVVTSSSDTKKASVEHFPPMPAAQTASSSSAVELTLPSLTTSPTAEPYFEYSIHQTISFSPSGTTRTELSAQPFITLDSANAQTDKLFQNARQQYEILSMRCQSTTTKILHTGISVYEATMLSIDDPSKTLTLRLWVERAEVSVYANHTPSASPTAPLISKVLYALRLWRLVDEATATDSDSDAEDDNEDEEQQKDEGKQIRIYHPLPQICTQLHTTLESANRAARRVQIELSHEKAPKPFQANWQAQKLRELNGKLVDLCREVEEAAESGAPSLVEDEAGGRRGYWSSTFQVGPGGPVFELLVASVGVSGLRNL